MRPTRSISSLSALGASIVLTLALASTAFAGGRPFTTTLSGAAEIGGGDPDGSGSAMVTVNPGTTEVCWAIHVEGITLPATAAHIHAAPIGVNGGIVIPLSAPDANGDAAGCTTASRELVLAIVLEPWNYYVNVHNTDYPGGALRGQLSR